MTDQLYLSIWLERNNRVNRMRYFERLLRLFPFSQREQGQTTITIQAVDSTEPPLLERPVNGPPEVDEILSTLQDYAGDDIAYRVETFWDLWQLHDDWVVAPARITLCCFGPEFDYGTASGKKEQEDLRIEFGVDAYYLPQPEMEGSGRLIESNVKSMLRLVHEIETALPVEKRKLETESGENFANRLQQVLTGNSVQ